MTHAIAADPLVPTGHAGLVQAVGATDADEIRWRQWKAKGRDDDARFRKRLKTVIVDLAGAAAVGGALWFAFKVLSAGI